MSLWESVNGDLTSKGLDDAATAFKALRYGDTEHDASPHEEVGYLMLARIYQCFVVDHQPKKSSP